MHAAVSAKTRLVYICNPNNPTGTMLDSAAIAAFVAALPDHVTTVIDEAYMEFVEGGSLVGQPGQRAKAHGRFADILQASRHGGG